MKADEMSYSQAIAEVESIVDSFNDRQFDIDELAAKLKRATELIKFCRTRLRKAENEVAKILKEE